MTNHWETVEYDLSASRLKSHAKCPMQYEIKYIKNLPPTKAKKGYGEMGGWVHQTIENVLEDNRDEFDEHVLHSMFQQEFYRLGDNHEVDKSIIDENQMDVATNSLQVAARYIASQNQYIEAIEQPINFHIDNPSIDRTAYGKIDIVTQDGEIWDWKTGTINENYTPRDELIQGCIYMGGYYNEFGELPKKIKFVYLKEEKVREVEPDQDNWQEMLKFARKLVEDEATGEFEAIPESGKCYFCDYEYYCPASDVGIGRVNEMVAKGEFDMWNAI